jgi:hypothetical protein
MEQTTIDKIRLVLKRHQESVHHYHCGDEAEQIASLINHYEKDAASAVAGKLDMTDNTLTYFRSVVMLAESAMMAGTHGEKNARLRGLIDLLNHTIEKLKHQKSDNLLHHSGYFSWDMATYPYQSIINKLNDAQLENERLKKVLKDNNLNQDEIPY